MVTPTLTANALILMSVNSFVPIPMMIQRSVIDARKAPFAQIMLVAMNAQDYGLANGLSGFPTRNVVRYGPDIFFIGPLFSPWP